MTTAGAAVVSGSTVVEPADGDRLHTLAVDEDAIGAAEVLDLDGAPVVLNHGVLTLADALLAPTRIYVKPILKAMKQTDAVKALAHITGGGFIENIPRVLPKTTVAEIDLDYSPETLEEKFGAEDAAAMSEAAK